MGKLYANELIQTLKLLQGLCFSHALKTNLSRITFFSLALQSNTTLFTEFWCFANKTYIANAHLTPLTEDRIIT